MISVIVTHYKTPGLLTLCLQSLEAASAAMPEDTEIIVVDGETQPEHQMIVRDALPSAQFIGLSENVGYATLVNTGLRRARGRHRLILNADIIAQPSALRTLTKFMDEHTDVGIAGPQLRGFDGAVQDSRFRFYTLGTILARRTAFGRTSRGKRMERHFLMRDVDRRHVHDTDWLLGSALMVREEALNEVGGMDEGFFLYFEDVDWCRRMWENGYRVTYVPDAVMHHYHQRASDSGRGFFDIIMNSTTRIHLRSALRYFWKYRNRSLQSHTGS